MNTRDFQLRLRIQETFFKNFRCALGVRRQQRSTDQDAIMRRMQDFCGDIEMSLYSARVKLSSRNIPTNSTGQGVK